MTASVAKTMKDYLASLEKLRRDAAEAALIRDLAEARGIRAIVGARPARFTQAPPWVAPVSIDAHLRGALRAGPEIPPSARRNVQPSVLIGADAGS